MSIYSNVSEQDLLNLRKLAEQQKNQRSLKIRNRFLKQTHEFKLAENLSPITKKLDEVNKSTQELGDVIKESNTRQPAIENTPQPAIENTPEPIENIEGIAYDAELETTSNNMKDDTGFSKTYYDSEHGWISNGYPVKMLGGTEVEIDNKKYNITRGTQNVFTQTSNIPLKKFNNQEREIYNQFWKLLMLRIINLNLVNLNRLDINNLKAILINVI